MKYDYTQSDLRNALSQIGLVTGDSVFIHSNIGFFGRMEGVKTADELCKCFIQTLMDTVSEKGTLVFPSFSYSFCHNEVFNPEEAKTECGLLSDYALKTAGTIRSLDPNFSIVSWGKLAKFYTENPTHESFGKGSFWERFLDNNGKIVCMNFDCGSTFVHYVEKSNNVSYRFNKAFNGVIEFPDGNQKRDYAVHYVFEGEKDYPCFKRLDQLCREKGICKTSKLGKGSMLSFETKEYYDLISNTLIDRPRFLTVEE